MKIYSTIIIEDEKEDLDLVINLLKEYEFIKIIATAKDVETAIAVITLNKPDLIFLDILLYGRLSFDILDTVYHLNIKPKVIITTAFDEFMGKSFKYSAFDYLLKPIDREELKDTLTRFVKNENQEDFDKGFYKLKATFGKLIFGTISGFEVINPGEILYLSTIKNQTYTELFLSNGEKIIVTKNIGKIEKMLVQSYFFKIHRSYIINLNYVRKVNRLKRICVLQNGDIKYKIPISKEKSKVLKEKFNDLS